MVFLEKQIFDFFVGKDIRHRLEDKERIGAAREMGIPRHQLEMMAPGDMPRRALPQTAFPLQREMMRTQYPQICACGAERPPRGHDRRCSYRGHNGHQRYPREGRRLQPQPRHRRRHGRPEDLVDDDDNDDEDYEGNLIPYGNDDYSIASSLSSDLRSYDRRRPHYGAMAASATGTEVIMIGITEEAEEGMECACMNSILTSIPLRTRCQCTSTVMPPLGSPLLPSWVVMVITSAVVGRYCQGHHGQTHPGDRLCADGCNMLL